MNHQEVVVGSEEIHQPEAQTSKEDLARRVAHQAEADAATWKRKFAVPVLPILDPILTNEEVLANLLLNKAEKEIEAAKTQRLPTLIEPMPLLSHEVAASIIALAWAGATANAPPLPAVAVIDPPPPEVTPVIPLWVHEEIPDSHLLDDIGPLDEDTLMLSDNVLFDPLDDNLGET